MKINKSMLIVLFVSFSIQAAKSNERAAYIRTNYTKFEYRIPMRDGAKLFTAVYSPTDHSKTYPILILRTPYSVGPYGADQYKSTLGPTEEFEKEGFIFVFQDVRGCFMSEGQFINMRPFIENRKSSTDIDESTDAYDTIDWLVRHVENNNGRVGMWGISYPGFYTSSGAINSHPALKAVSPQAPIGDWFWDDMHHHGALTLALSFRFLSTFGQKRDSLRTGWPKGFDFGTSDGYEFYLNMGPLQNANKKYFKDKIDFWNQITKHPNYDAFWQSRNILPHLKNIGAAVMTVGGWFDAEDLYGALNTYQWIEKNNPGIFNVLVMGPWFHGGWVRSPGDKLGDAEFGFKTSIYFQQHFLLRFFNHFLKAERDKLDFPEALVFETGANRWRQFDHWPPLKVKEKKLYLRDQFKLSFAKPTPTDTVFDAYVSDPLKPVPYTKEVTTRWAKTYMTEDQRFAARRPDVLAYQSAVLKNDVTVAGPLQADLYVSTSGTASDWIVKLVDVLPDDDSEKGGQQLMIRGEIFRGRFRESYEEPKPFVPNRISEVTFRLQDILHTFKRGHKIMIQIQSTWFPLFDRNPQNYVPNIFEANEDDFISVTNKVYRFSRYPSHIRVNVLE